MTTFLQDYLRAIRLFSRDVWMYLLTAALFGISYFGFVTVLLNLYLVRLGYDTAFIGLVNGSTALAFALSSVPSGAAGARWGYRRAAVAGVILVGLGALCLPIAEFLPTAGQSAGILVARLASGVGFALYFVNTNPYLVSATEPRERTYVFSMQTGILPMAGFLGNLIAGVLPGIIGAALNLPVETHPAPFRYALMLGGLILLPGAFILLNTSEATRDDSTATDKTTPLPLKATPYLLIFFLAITGLLRMAGEGAARTFFNVYLDVGLGVSVEGIGLLLAFGQIVAGPAAFIAPMLAARAGKISAIVVSTLATAISLVIMALVPNWFVVSIGFMGVIGMRAITQSVVNVVQMEIVPVANRGTTSGLVSMAMGTGFTSIALGGGYLVPIIDFPGVFFIAAGMVTVSSLIFWLYFRHPRGEYAIAVEEPRPAIAKS